jgi:hypothetical protein
MRTVAGPRDFEVASVGAGVKPGLLLLVAVAEPQPGKGDQLGLQMAGQLAGMVGDVHARVQGGRLIGVADVSVSSA